MQEITKRKKRQSIWNRLLYSKEKKKSSLQKKEGIYTSPFTVLENIFGRNGIIALLSNVIGAAPLPFSGS